MKTLKKLATPLLRAARNISRRFTRRARIERQLSPYLPEAVCIDVGASYYPHGKWHLFLQSPSTRWVAVEPNHANISYVKIWPWPSRVSVCTQGLSKAGGNQTLYITNIDSGSSLLEPVIPPSMERRIRNLDYFFPLRTHVVETITLGALIDVQRSQAPVFVKLDTQGTELSILQGAEPCLRASRIVGIELEATMLAEPIMRGAGKFWEACQYLETFGFELLHVKPIYGPSRIGRKRPRGVTFINECDAVFALRPDIVRKLPVDHRANLFAFYLCNRLFEEALLLLREDEPLQSVFARRGCNLQSLGAAIQAMA